MYGVKTKMNLNRMKSIFAAGIGILIAAGSFAQVPAPEAAANLERTTKANKNIVLSKDLEVPYISTYYVEPNVLTTQDVKISFYVTDWHQSEYRLQDKSHRFNAFLQITDSQKNTRQMQLKNIPAGDHSFAVGKLPEGDYQIRLYAIDKYRRYSPSIFHEFRVRKTFEIPADAVYKMTPDDLRKYRIFPRGNYGSLHFVDATGKNEAETKAIVEAAAANVKVEPYKYVVVVGGSKAPADLLIGKKCGAYNLPVPEWLPNHYSRRTAKVIYAPGYRKEYVEQQSVETGKGINQFLKDLSEKGVRKVVFLPGTYRISHKTPINIPSNMTVDLNRSTIKMNECTEKGAIMVRILNCYDSHMVNGIVEGDYFEHDYSINKSSEWLNGIEIVGESKYCSFNNMIVRFITGYGVCNGFHGVDGDGFSGLKFTPGTINRYTGKEIKKAGLQISQMVSIKKLKQKFGYFTVSRFLGYQGMAMDDWNLMYHFFDSEKKYLETIDGEQYRRVRPPENAEFVRVTVWAAGEIRKGEHIVTNYFRTPQNCAFENIYVQNARCVGIAPSAMYNMKFANITVTRSGENLARCAFDAEDGWDMMQDVWLYRLRFIGNPNNELLTCAGHNFVFEENEANLHLWSRTASYVIRNNKFKSANFGYANRKRTRLVRIENNTYSGTQIYGEGREGIKPAELMNAYRQELAGKSRTLDSNWMIFARGNFSGGGVVTNGAGALYGSDLKEMPKSARFNLLMSRLRNTSLTWLANSNFVNCIIEDCHFSMFKASKKIVGCKIKNTGFQLSQGTHLILENCTLENVELYHGYWITPCKVTLKNCIVKNKDKALFRTPAYSTDVMTIENCLIDTGSAPMFNMYDTRAQKTDNLVGTINIEKSQILNTSGFIVRARGKNNQKVINFNIDGVRFPGKIVDEPSPKWKINVSPMAAFKSVHRGWDPRIEPLILELVGEKK